MSSICETDQMYTYLRIYKELLDVVYFDLQVHSIQVYLSNQ